MAIPSTDADDMAASQNGAPPAVMYAVKDHQEMARPGVIARAAAIADRRRCLGVTSTDSRVAAAGSIASAAACAWTWWPLACTTGAGGAIVRMLTGLLRPER